MENTVSLYWWVAADTLNKQSRTADKRWSSSSWFGQMLTTPHRKKIFFVTKYYAGPRN